MAKSASPTNTPEPEKQVIEVDVVILGGGFAGLAAADTLRTYCDALGLPKKFVVLERESRLGGRTHTGEDDYFDFGGGFVGATQNYLQFYVRRFGIPTIGEYLPDDKSWLFENGDGTVDVYPGDDSFALPGENLAVDLLGALDALSLQLRSHLNDLKAWPFARKFVGMSVEEWARGEFLHQVERARNNSTAQSTELEAQAQRAWEAFVVSVRTAFSHEPRRISMFFLLYYAATAGCYSALVDVTGGTGAAEGTRFLYGTRSILTKLEEEINKPERAGAPRLDLIKRGVMVTQVEHCNDHASGSGHVLVRACSMKGAMPDTTQARVYKAKALIVAASPRLQSTNLPAGQRVNWVFTGTEPPEWRARQKLAAHMFMGQTIKGFVKYKRPFWRDLGMMGFVLSANDAKIGGPKPPTHAPEGFRKMPLDWVMDYCWSPPTLPPLRPGHVGDVGRKVPHFPKSPFALMTFIVGDAAEHWQKKTKAQRAEAVITHLVKLLGEQAWTELATNYATKPWPPRLPPAMEGDEAESPWNSYVDFEWHSLPIGGAPTGLLPMTSDDAPDPLDLYVALRRPVGRLFWAGTESADEWCGYINGAIQSGTRAAAEAIAMVLGGRPPSDDGPFTEESIKDLYVPWFNMADVYNPR